MLHIVGSSVPDAQNIDGALLFVYTVEDEELIHNQTAHFIVRHTEKFYLCTGERELPEPSNGV